jgi:DNA-binding Lrp family transcriptional regulator
MPVSPRPLDDVDRRMLGILVEDGRMSVNELASRAGVSRATAYARYDRLVAEGVIRRFRADVNPHAIGLDVAAMILINVTQGAWPMTRDKVSRLPGVEYVAMTSGESCWCEYPTSQRCATLCSTGCRQCPRYARLTRSSSLMRSAIPPGRRSGAVSRTAVLRTDASCLV